MSKISLFATIAAIQFVYLLIGLFDDSSLLVGVAQWQSTSLWYWGLRVRLPSLTPCLNFQKYTLFFSMLMGCIFLMRVRGYPAT